MYCSSVNIYAMWLIVMNGRWRNTTNVQIWGMKKTRIMMATVPHVTAWAGCMKYRADGFLFDWVYIISKDFSLLSYAMAQAITANLSLLTARFNPWLVLVWFVMHKVAMGQDFLWTLKFFPVSMIPPMLHTHFCHNITLITRTGRWS
jgi:hypothetical protein